MKEALLLVNLILIILTFKCLHFSFLGLICSIPALIFSIRAREESKKEEHVLTFVVM